MNKKIIISLFIPIFIIFWYLQASAQENLTITTYYPSPSGSYNELRAEHIAIGYMNRSDACWDPANPGCGTDISDNATRNIDLIVEGSVGIGTKAPNATLDVVGGVRVGDDTAACDASHPEKKGTIRFNDPTMEYCDGTEWRAMGGAALQVQTFDTVGAKDFTVPPGVTYLNLKLWGAGGGGGGGLYNDSSGCEAAGGGAGGGAYIEAGYIVTPGDVYTITVGAGGDGKSTIQSNTLDARTGDDGGNTILANSANDVIFRAGGGKGGKGCTQAMCNKTPSGGAGGTTYVITDTTGPNPAINIIQRTNGGKGNSNDGSTILSQGDGGDAPNGGVGGNKCGTVNGNFPGGGGSGGECTSYWGVYHCHGGNGANGEVVLTW